MDRHQHHEPAAFCCGLLNSLPMGFYSSSQLIQDVRRHGIEVRPVDVQRSHWDHGLERSDTSPGPGSGPDPWGYHYRRQQGAIRLGLRQVTGFNEAAAERIAAARTQAPLRSVEDLARRARLDAGELRCLAEADALRGLAGHRHQSHWETAAVKPEAPLWQSIADSSASNHFEAFTDEDVFADESAPTEALRQPSSSSFEVVDGVAEQAGDAALTDAPSNDEGVQLPAPTLGADVLADYASLGLTLSAHPMALLRRLPAFRGCRQASDLGTLNHGRFVRIAGLVTGRQRPGTASGVLFLTLEDETGNHNVVIWSSVLARFRGPILGGRLLLVKGVLEREGRVIHVVAGHVADYSHHLGDLRTDSRDFH